MPTIKFDRMPEELRMKRKIRSKFTKASNYLFGNSLRWKAKANTFILDFFNLYKAVTLTPVKRADFDRLVYREGLIALGKKLNISTETIPYFDEE